MSKNKLKQAVDVLVGKSKACECGSPCSGCKDSNPVRYKITAVLDKSTYDKDLKRYLFVSPIDRRAIAVAYPEVEFPEQVTIWRFTELLNESQFESLTIKRIDNGNGDKA